MPAKETLSTRVTRLEEAQIRVGNAMAHLAEVQAETKQQMLELGKETDRRIGQLVSAIGELIAQMKNGKKE